MQGTQYSLRVHVDPTTNQLILDGLSIRVFNYSSGYVASRLVTKDDSVTTFPDAYAVHVSFLEDEAPDLNTTTLTSLLRLAVGYINDQLGYGEVALLVDPQADVTDHPPYFIVFPFITSSGDLTEPQIGDVLTVHYTGAGHQTVGYQWQQHDVQAYSYMPIAMTDATTYIVASADIGYRLTCSVVLNGIVDVNADALNETGKVPV